MHTVRPILLYDIDGTLLKVKRQFLLELIGEQLKAFNVEKPESKTKSFAGRTDRGIFMELIGEHPDSERLFAELKEQYSKAMIRDLLPSKIERIDGADESVRQAADLGIHVGLCTGNFREVAFKKVETAGLKNLFRFGGFGGEYADRNMLPGEADRDYRSVYGETPPPSSYVVIGDTPNDIRCAKYFGAVSVAVTTGGFSKDKLAAHNPDLILDSLADPARWLSELGFRLP